MEKISSLRDALKVLSRATTEQRDDLQDLFQGEFKDLKDVLGTLIPEAQTFFEKIKNEAKEKGENVKDEAQSHIDLLQKYVEERLKSHPLQVLGGAIVAALIVGLILGRKH